MEKFFRPGITNDPSYMLVRDNIETLWKAYSPVCPDLDFLSQAQINFIGMTWQMQLWAILVNYDFEVVPAGSKGPDICFMKHGVRHWIEAVAADAGTKEADAVPKPKPGIVYSVPERQIILRLKPGSFDGP